MATWPWFVVMFGVAVLARGLAGYLRDRRGRAPVALRRSEVPTAAAPRQPAGPVEHDSPTMAMSGDFVRLVGHVRSADTLTAAVSGRRCVAYLARARVRRPHRDQLVADILETKLAPVVVVVGGDEVAIGGDCVIEWPTTPVAHSVLDRAVAFLASRNVAHYAASTEFEEAVIQSGDRVWITGTLVQQRGRELGYRDLPVYLRLVASRQHPLTIGPASVTGG